MLVSMLWTVQFQLTIIFSLSVVQSCFQSQSCLVMNGGQPRENFYYEALAFSGHNINLTFDEENMKPEKTQSRLKTQALVQVP